MEIIMLNESNCSFNWCLQHKFALNLDFIASWGFMSHISLKTVCFRFALMSYLAQCQVSMVSLKTAVIW